MGNRRLYIIECFHMLGTFESEWLKVTALNLFHPTASPPFQKVGFFHIATQSLEGEGEKAKASICFKEYRERLHKKWTTCYIEWVKGEEMEKKARGTRDRNILEIVRGVLLSGIAFQDILKKYKEGRLRFLDIGIWVDDKGHSLLYNLKEQCHSLYRYEGKKTIHKNEWLLDLVIGSIFHEAMKLRENIYQMEVYRPKYLQYKLKAGKSNYEMDYLQQFERIILKAKQGVAEGMEETKSLFQDAMDQLIDLFKESAKNIFLVRFLLENLTLLRKVYGFKKVKEIFNLMFKKGLLDAYQLSAQSYLQSEHYDLSAHYFSKALQMDPRNHNLQFLLNFSLGMNEYYRNAYSKSLSYFTRLIPLKSNGKLKKDYLKKVEEVCNKICSEWQEERGMKGAKKASSLADRIRKCYDGFKRST